MPTPITDQQVQEIQQMTAAIVADQQAYDQSLANQASLQATMTTDNSAIASAQAQLVVDTDAYNAEVANGQALQQQTSNDIEALDSFIQSLFPATPTPAPVVTASVKK